MLLRPGGERGALLLLVEVEKLVVMVAHKITFAVRHSTILSLRGVDRVIVCKTAASSYQAFYCARLVHVGKGGITGYIRACWIAVIISVNYYFLKLVGLLNKSFHNLLHTKMLTQ